jgi:pyridoxal 5'-phosphate synthase pdxT subunit
LKRVGVLALQGDVVEHLHALRRAGVEAVEVKNERDLAGVDALIVPGGESTTVIRLLERFALVEPIKARVRDGMPFWGTCMGMIVAAKDVADMEQDTLGLLDITVRRNAFGRQVASFEGDIDFAGLDDPVHAVFIRAPWVEQAGPDVEVLARVEEGPAAGRIVAVRQRSLMATSFHPEVGSDDRIHRLFLDLID